MEGLVDQEGWKVGQSGRLEGWPTSLTEFSGRSGRRLEGRPTRRLKGGFDQPYRVPGRPGRRLEGRLTILTGFMADLLAFLTD
ncbi:hypothetical protein SESBI_14789 [Sesbania bispinosa]|nr:hypothetical protein SESBI_14789 [Sesbania bispinosa]